MPVKVEGAGVDTWSPAWYVGEDSPAARALDALATVPTRRGKLVADPILGHRIGWVPAARLAFAEGHPAEAVGTEGLLSPDLLPEALWRVWDACTDYGLLLPEGLPVGPLRVGPVEVREDGRPGFAGVRRCDATVDLRFDSSAEGLAFLQGVAAIGMPRAKQAVWRDVGGAYDQVADYARQEAFANGCDELADTPREIRALASRPIETVAFYGHGGHKMLARVYDKSVEASLGRRGTLIRPEDQRRYTKGTRRGVDELHAAYVRNQFHRRFVPLYQASEGIKVGGSEAIAAKLGELVDDGVITIRQAERILGYAGLEQAGVWRGDRRTYFRRRAELREAGLVLDDLGIDQVEVDVAAVLEQALEAEAWGRG